MPARREASARAMRELGLDAFEAAAMFWLGGYDPDTERVTEVRFAIVVPDAIGQPRRSMLRSMRPSRRSMQPRGGRRRATAH